MTSPRSNPVCPAAPATESVEGGALRDLLARVEAATGPDRELDAHIYGALGFQIIHRFSGLEWRPERKGVWHTMPSLTASLDAALTLVERTLPGWRWMVRRIEPSDHPSFGAYVEEIDGKHFWCAGPTPSLALLAAMLTALSDAAPPARTADPETHNKPQEAS